MPIREGPDALKVNWCELLLIHQESGEQLYYSAWLTDHALDETPVEAVTQDGRSRWKVENEGINVLKQRGYHFEHNYGHGAQHLSTVLLSLLLLRPPQLLPARTRWPAHPRPPLLPSPAPPILCCLPIHPRGLGGSPDLELLAYSRGLDDCKCLPYDAA